LLGQAHINSNNPPPDLKCPFRNLHVLTTVRYTSVNTKNRYKKETDLWAEFGKETPFDRKFSSKHSVKMPAVGSMLSFGRRAVLRLEEEAFGNT
jgi:hypothetical protein